MQPITIEQTIEQYLDGMHDEELVLARLRNAAKNANFQTDFTADELRWLENHFDKLPCILRSKMACKIYTTINRMKGAYLRQLCRMISGNTKKPLCNSTVDWWLKKFFTIDLFFRRNLPHGWGNEVWYYTPKLRYPNLIKFLIYLMEKRLGKQ